MRYFLFLIIALMGATAAAAQSDNYFVWTEKQIVELQEIIAVMPSEGLNGCEVASITGPNSAVDPNRRSRLATSVAIAAMRAHVHGCATSGARAGWNIASDDPLIDFQSLLRLALIRDELGSFFDALKPRNPNYQALHDAYVAEKDPAKRKTLALNMERWRWMPLIMGDKYLLVNAASFEVTLWEKDRKIETWPVIVGKTKTFTPIFRAMVNGVVLNPWWEIPSSIVAESVGASVRNSPATARQRGYVLQNGRYRQRPGPGNSLGQMKLVMPNPYSVYLHDTPNKNLFDKPVRAFSHGCVRVGGAIDFVKTLLQGSSSDQKVDDILKSKKTTTVSLAESIPVYIAYFTAEGLADGSISYFPDIYSRDAQMVALREQGTDCASG